MLLIAAALALQAADPAVCELEFSGIDKTDRHPDAVRILCPSDVADAGGLQAAADAAAAALDLDLPRADGSRSFADQAVFVRGEDGRWAPAPGQEIIVETPAISPRAVERGARHLMCASAFEPDAQGRPAKTRIACIDETGDQRGRGLRYMRRSMERSLEGTRVLPVDMAYCLYTERFESAQVIAMPGRRAEAPTPPPDPADLPNDLCQREPD